MAKKTTGKKPKENRVTLTMYTQQVEYLNKIEKPMNVADAEGMLATLDQRFKDAGINVKYMASIKHDKDMQEVWDERQADYVLEPKDDHIHTVIKFEDRVELKKVAEAIGDAEQNFEKPKSGRYAEENMLAYLIHAKSPSKHHYDLSEVKQLGVIGSVTERADGSYRRYHDERKQAWDRQRLNAKNEERKLSIPELREWVLDFRVSRKRLFTEERLYEVYLQEPRKIDEAFNIRVEKRFWEVLRAFEQHEFVLSTIYIYGQSGHGKTTLAQDILRRLEAEGHDTYVGGASNPFDDYSGEEIVLLDDVKPNTLSPENWLKVLDNNSYHGYLGARYKNKRKTMKTIIMTGVDDPNTFFSRMLESVKGYSIEPLEQFIRRLWATVQAKEFNYEVGLLTYDGDYSHGEAVSGFLGLDKSSTGLVELIKTNNNPDVEHSRQVANVFDAEQVLHSHGLTEAKMWSEEE